MGYPIRSRGSDLPPEPPRSQSGLVQGDYRGTRALAECAYCGSTRVSSMSGSCANCGAPRNDVAVARAPIVYPPDQVSR